MVRPGPGFNDEIKTALSADAEPGFPIERRSQLTVLSGARAGTVVEVTKDKLRVGKGEDNDVVLPDATVSRDHFEIINQGDGYLVRDLGSTNGLWLDQYRIREAFLRPGSIVKAGDVQLRFEPLFKPMAVPAWPEEHFGSLVGRSQRMRELFSMLNRLSGTDATVVILGETGSGKGAVARAIHDASPRRKAPFVVVDCGAIADNLIESELFGHERGAFTGATSTRRGALEQAAGGTLFIDELLELRLDLQPKLLRALEEREFRRVGGSQTIKLEARIMAASQRDLWQQVQLGKFREDLYFRLAVFTLPIPPLRERAEDIPLLCQNFARAMPGGDALTKKLTPQFVWRLQQHGWPGNVRELRNVVERALYLADADDVAALFAPERTAFPGARPAPVNVGAPPPAPPAATPRTAGLPTTSPGSAIVVTAELDTPFKDAKEKLLEQFEAAYLRRLMERTGGQVSAAAREAGIDRKHLYTLLKKYGMMTTDEA
ncbi:MAG: sigma 54-dependent Fis family transcriptional regulator [Deltaproteobacteria bacterium]|nr:sigma 54-dependent Fis family transcriptional regulator [Deltaproteobacteria bacterium]